MKKDLASPNQITDKLKALRHFSGDWLLSEVKATPNGDNGYNGEFILVNPKMKDRSRSLLWSASYSGKGVWEIKNNDPRYKPETPFSIDPDTHIIICREISGWLNSHVDKGDHDRNGTTPPAVEKAAPASSPRVAAPQGATTSRVTITLLAERLLARDNRITTPAVVIRTSEKTVMPGASEKSVTVSAPTIKPENVVRNQTPPTVSPPPSDGRVQVLNRRILRIPIDLIRPNRDQPRKKKRSQASLKSLGLSIIKDGQNTPADVIPAVGIDSEYPKAQYELVKGESRWMGLRLVGGTHLEAIVLSPKEIPDKDKQHRYCLIGDSQQEGYAKMDMARALAREYKDGEVSMEELGRLCGKKSVAWVSQHLALIKLHPDLQRLLDPDLPRGEQLSFTIACRLARVPKEKQLEFWRDIHKIRGSRLQLLKTQELTKPFMPDKRAGRVRKPGDNVKSMTVAIPRVLGDVTVTARYPASTFESFVEHHEKGEVSLLLRHLKEARDSLSSIEQKILAAQKKK